MAASGLLLTKYNENLLSTQSGRKYQKESQMANTAEQSQVTKANTIKQNQAVGAVAELLRLLVQREEQAEERRWREEERRRAEEDEGRRAEEERRQREEERCRAEEDERCQREEERRQIEIAERERTEVVFTEERRKQRCILETPASTERRPWAHQTNREWRYRVLLDHLQNDDGGPRSGWGEMGI